jgi:transposase
MQNLIARCAGLDVHKKTVVACARVVAPDDTVELTTRTFGTMTADLEDLAGWLAELGVTDVAMEATGVYWKPVWHILERSGRFALNLVNPRDIKQVPGRKTDVKDAEWIAMLLAHGLLPASFVPPPSIRRQRDLTRQRAVLVRQKARVANRVQKVLEEANIRLGSVASDVLGASGRAMIGALIEGRDDPEELADLARGRLREKGDQLRRALRGAVTEHHRFLLRTLMDQVRHLDGQIARYDERIAEAMGGEAGVGARPDPSPVDPAPAPADPGEVPAPAPADPGEVPAPAEAASAGPVGGATTAAEAARRLTTIPGIGERTAEVIVAEIGVDMDQFPTAGHLASWAGICPGNDVSAGVRRTGKTTKGSVWLRTALVQAAWAASHTKGTSLAAAYRCWAKRLGRKKALVALGHKILKVAYTMLKAGTDYTERLPKGQAI